MAQVHNATAAFRLDARLLGRLEEKARRQSMSVAELMRAAVRRELVEDQPS